MTTRQQKIRTDVLEALAPTETKATRKARAVMLKTLEPLAPLDKLRVLGAVCVLLGHYGVAGDLLELVTAQDGGRK